MFNEFKKFALRGNVVDLAIGVIIGLAFSNIVTSFNVDVITPLLLQPVLEATGLNNLEDLTILGSVKYGKFLAAILNFIVVAFILFLIVKGIKRCQTEGRGSTSTAARNPITYGDQGSSEEVSIGIVGKP